MAQQQHKELTERRLHHTRLCKFLLKKGCKRPNCNFAHSLEDLRPTPFGFLTYEGHFWTSGQMKSPETLALLRRFLEYQGGNGPAWVDECLKESSLNWG